MIIILWWTHANKVSFLFPLSSVLLPLHGHMRALIHTQTHDIIILMHAHTHVQINFVQCDRGVYTYRTENLSITLGLEGPLLTLSLKPQRGKPYQLFMITKYLRDFSLLHIIPVRKCLGSRWFRHTIEILQERSVYMFMVMWLYIHVLTCRVTCHVGHESSVPIDGDKLVRSTSHSSSGLLQELYPAASSPTGIYGNLLNY